MRLRRGYILMAVLLVVAVAFVACDDGKEPVVPEPLPEYEAVSVTFDMNGEGENVVLTGQTGEAMQAPECEDGERYYFGGWAKRADLAGETLAEGAKFPERDTTYYAKWYVKYAVEVSVEREDGTFERVESMDVEGEALKGEQYATVAAEEFDVPANHAPVSDVRVQLESRDNVAELKIELAALNVTYEPCLAGVQSVTVAGKYGMSAADEGIFEGVEGMRLLGWAESEGSKPDIGAGDRLDISGAKTLYAVWAKGYYDALGGLDVIYVAKGISETATLVRPGLEPTEGVYDGESGTVSFRLGDMTLEGKLLENSFFYFKDAYEREFSPYLEGRTDRLKLLAAGGAQYTDENGKLHTGSYFVDESSGDFVFDSEDFKAGFRLYEPYFGIGDITFRMADGFEGYYAEKSADGFGFNVLYFDGYGFALEIWDPDRPYYDPYEEAEGVAFEGEYELIGLSNGMPQAEVDILRSPAYGYDVMYTVRIDLSKTGSLSGVEIMGAYSVADSYAGTYADSDYENDETRALVLDGYEYATFRGVKGTYEAKIIQWYVFEGEYDEEDQQVYDIHSHPYIEFYGEDGSKALLELNRSDYNERDLYSVLSPEQNVFEFENATDLLYDADGDIMLELWHARAYVWLSHAAKNRVTYYTLLDEGDVSEAEDGWRHFSGSVDFDFKITDCEQDYTVRWRGAGDRLVFVPGELYIDASGAGKYSSGGVTVTVEYTVDSGFVDIYRFYDVGGRDREFVVKDGQAEEMTLAPVLEEERSTNGLVVKLALLADGRTIIGFRLSDGVTYAYLIEGTAVRSDDEYSFEMSGVEEGYEQALEEYLSFRFMRDGGAFVRNDGYEFVATGEDGEFAADGYGNATLTPKGSAALSGEYEFVGDITVFVYDGGEIYLSVQGEGAVREFALVGEEAGYYFEIVAGAVSSQSSYFFLDGKGGVTYSLYYADRGSFAISEGSYEATGESDEDGYKLYRFTFADDDFNMPGGYKAHLGEERATDGRTVRTYWLENPVSSGTYIVRLYGEDWGMLTVSKGTAMWMMSRDDYAVGTMIKCDVLDGDIITQYADGTRVVRENAEGKSILFCSGSAEDGTYFEFVFDITGETETVDGEQYAVIEARMYDYGMFAKYDGELKEERIYLDGRGGMTVYDAAGGIADSGYVSEKEEGGNVLTFTGEKSSFDFLISLRMISETYQMYRFEYVVYDEDSDHAYIGEDYSVLLLDGFGGATSIDKYGMPTYGTYSYVVGNVIKFEYNIADVAYIALNDGKFEINDSEFICVDRVLYYYMGDAQDVVIPADVLTVAKDAFYGSHVTSVDLSNVQRVEEGAFSGLAISRIASEALEYIGEGAFADMGTYLKTVDLPNVKSIGAGAFYGDTALERVRLGDVEYIGSQAFTLSVNGGTVPFDMTSAKNPGAAMLEDDAIVALTSDGETADTDPPIRALVKDIATVNALMESESASALIRDNAVICFGEEVTLLEASLTEFKHAYFSAKTGDAYILDGKLSRIIDVDACTVESVAIYEFARAAEGYELSLYMLKDGKYDTQPIKAAGGVIELGDDILFELGTETKAEKYTFTDGDGKTLELSPSVRYDVIKGLIIDADIAYDGSRTDSASEADGKFAFVLGEAQYSVEITGKDSCVVKKAGEAQYVLSANGKFRLGLTFDSQGTLVSCISLQERVGENYVSRKVNSSMTRGDGTLSVNADPVAGLRSDNYIVSYDADTGFAILAKSGTAYCDDDDGFRYGVTLTWDEETYQAIDCAAFTMEDAEYEVKAFETTATNFMRITVDMNGTDVTFEVRYTAEFGFAVISVRRV